jgi:hypothetical protein
VTTYYIDPSSGTNGNGLSESTPFNTWTAVTWAYGNKYLQKAGTTYTNQIVIGNGSLWSASNKKDGIVVGSYGTANSGRAIINGTSNSLKYGIQFGGVAAGNTYDGSSRMEYITIQDFEILNIIGGTPTANGDGTFAIPDGRAIYLYALNPSNADSVHGNNIIKNCYIHDCDFGISFVNVGGKIENNIMQRFGHSGIGILSSSNEAYAVPVDIVGNTIEYPAQRIANGDCIQVVERPYKYINVIGNTFRNTSTIKNLIILAATNNATITVENNYADGENLVANGFSCPNAGTYIVRGNIIKNVNGSGVDCYDVFDTVPAYSGPKVSHIYGNLIINCKYGIKTSGSYNSPNKVLYATNNTLVGCTESARFYGIADIIFKTNIIYNNVTSGNAYYLTSQIKSFDEANNIIFPEFIGMIKDYRSGINSTFNTVSSYLAHANVPDSDSFSSDPLLGANYAPTVGSPCLSTGVKWWTNARPSDVNGEPYPDVDIDIGAIQSTTNSFHPSNIK